MAGLCEKLNSSTSQHISSNHVWKHLSTMYDLTALNESEILPFPNGQVEFCLPEEFNCKDSSLDTSSNASVDDIGTHRDRHESGSSTRGSNKSDKSEKPSQKSTPSLLDESRSDESSSAKRDGRKRTRHSLQGSDSTPKRQRRT